jgi:hypothetical protein
MHLSKGDGKHITSTAMSDTKPIDVDSDDEEVVTKTKAAEPEVVEDTSLANPDVVTKYQECAKIVQAALVEVSAKVSSYAAVALAM